MTLLGHVIVLFLTLDYVTAASETEHSVHYNLNYPYVLNAVNHKFEGRICSDMELFALIPTEPDKNQAFQGGACVTRLETYLRLVVRTVKWMKNLQPTRPPTTTLMPHHQEATLHPYISNPVDLPPGVDFDIINSDLVDVDDAYYLVVSKPDTLRMEKYVHFYVVLVNTSDYNILSNPLPFVVRVDHPPEEGRPHGAAVFAGVLVLAIIMIALLIPVTVCVKRRRKAGKPVCKCSWGQGQEEESDVKSEVKGRVNNGFVDTRETRTDSSVSDPGHTIGSHQLGSVSSMHFQPTWLDPHYKDNIQLFDRRTPEVVVHSPSGSTDVKL